MMADKEQAIMASTATIARALADITNGLQSILQIIGESIQPTHQNPAQAKPDPATAPPQAPPNQDVNTHDTGRYGDKSKKPATDKQRKMIYAKAKSAGLEDDDIRALFKNITGKNSTKDYSMADIDRIVNHLAKSEKERVANEDGCIDNFYPDDDNLQF